MKKDFYKFIIKLALFLIVLFIVDRGIGSLFVTMKDIGLHKNPENMWLKTPFACEKVNSGIVIIGSSKASHHYIPQMIEDSLGISAYNCGQDGCFFLYQNCIINMLLDRYQPKCIIWDIQPGSFNENVRNLEYQNIRYLSPYYADNNWTQSYINNESSKMKFRMMSQMFAYNSKVLNYVFPLVIKSSKTDKGYLPLPNEGYNYPIMNNSIDENIEFRIPEEYLNLLENTIDRCKELNVDLKMYISPDFSVKSHATIAAEEAIQNVAKTHGIVCYNYHSDNRYMQDATYFKDASHLNDKGARLFTEIVINDLKNSK